VTKDGAYDKTRVEYRAYALLRFVITHLTLDYFLSTFAMYDLARCIAVWRGWYFYGHVGAAAMLVAAGIAHVLCRRPRNNEKSVAAQVEGDVAAGGVPRQASGAGSGAAGSAGDGTEGKASPPAPQSREGARKRRQG
jgi:hypothetical protein